MSRAIKVSSLIICIFSFLLLLTPHPLSATKGPVYTSLDVRVSPDLKVPAGKIKEDLLAGLEKGFSDKGVLLVSRQNRSLFTLSATISVKHFIKSAASYSVIFKVKHMKIVPTRYKNLIPALAYEPFTSRDRSGGVSPAQDLDDAVGRSLEDLLFMMDQYGLFDFFRHPFYSRVMEIKPADLQKVDSRADLDQMADKIIGELKLAIKVTMKTKPLAPVVNFPRQKDYTAQLKGIMKEIKELRRQKHSLKALKRLLNRKLKTLNALNFVNTASIIIETGAAPKGLTGHGSTIQATIVPDKSCTDCSESRIEAVNLGYIKNETDFNQLAQEEKYRIAYRMKGKLINKNGKWKLEVSTGDYRKIFEIDRNGRLKPGEIIGSVTDGKNLFPRILVKVGK